MLSDYKINIAVQFCSFINLIILNHQSYSFVKMQSTSRDKISELKMLITKMPLRMSCVTVLPELRLRWKEVSAAVRNANLPMTSQSVASVLAKYACNAFTVEEISNIIIRLKLKSIAIQYRTWHVIKLIDQIDDGSNNFLTMTLPKRIKHVLSNLKAVENNRRRAEVQTLKLGNLIYVGVQMLPQIGSRSVFCIAIPLGEPIALVSSLSSSLLSACVQALGYRKYEDACLNGKDVISLLNIYNSHQNTFDVVDLPEYTRVPCAVRSGIDYTGRRSLELHAAKALGPEPPLLNSLIVTAEKQFYDRERLDKKMKVSIHLKSENIAQTLQSLVMRNALAPDCDLLEIFHSIKSNEIHIDADDI